MGFFNTILKTWTQKENLPKICCARAPAEKKATVAPPPLQPHAAVMDKGERMNQWPRPKAISGGCGQPVGKLAAGKELNWKVSIVDLLKLLTLTAAAKPALNWPRNSTAPQI